MIQHPQLRSITRSWASACQQVTSPFFAYMYNLFPITIYPFYPIPCRKSKRMLLHLVTAFEGWKFGNIAVGKSAITYFLHNPVSVRAKSFGINWVTHERTNSCGSLCHRCKQWRMLKSNLLIVQRLLVLRLSQLDYNSWGLAEYCAQNSLALLGTKE